jgi:hypothetical protein
VERRGGKGLAGGRVSVPPPGGAQEERGEERRVYGVYELEKR